MTRQNSVLCGQRFLPLEAATETGVLCVGDPLRDCDFPPSMQYATGVEVVGWPILAEKLSLGKPIGAVYSATLSTNFDCVDIAQLLFRSGFPGRYRVIAPDFPKPELIRREVAAMCPGLDFDIEMAPPPNVMRFC